MNSEIIVKELVVSQKNGYRDVINAVMGYCHTDDCVKKNKEQSGTLLDPYNENGLIGCKTCNNPLSIVKKNE